MKGDKKTVRGGRKKTDRSPLSRGLVLFSYPPLFLPPPSLSLPLLSLICLFFYMPLSLFLSLSLSLYHHDHSAAIRIIYLSRLQRKLRWVEESAFPLALCFHLFFSVIWVCIVTSAYSSISAAGEHIFVSI